MPGVGLFPKLDSVVHVAAVQYRFRHVESLHEKAPLSERPLEPLTATFRTAGKVSQRGRPWIAIPDDGDAPVSLRRPAHVDHGTGDTRFGIVQPSPHVNRFHADLDPFAEVEVADPFEAMPGYRFEPRRVGPVGLERRKPGR